MMFKLITVTLLLVGAASAASDWQPLRDMDTDMDTDIGYQPFVDTANNYVDKLTENLRQHIRDNGLDPIGIPELRADFSKKILLVTVYGSARISNGKVYGLSTIHRAEDCDIGGDGTTVAVGCIIGINGIRGNFAARAEFMGTGVNAGISFGVDRVRVAFRVSANLATGSKPRLQHFSITEVSSVKVSIRGLGPLDWIFSKVANKVVKAVKHHIIAAIESPIRQELSKVLGRVKIPGLT